jgi:hypothetical protein
MYAVSVLDESSVRIRQMAREAYLHASHVDGNVAVEYAAALSHGDLLDFMVNRPIADHLMLYFDDDNIESWRKSRAAQERKDKK